jgi:hypothetical protein
MKTQNVNVLRAGFNVSKHYSCLDVFLFMFPATQLEIMFRCNNLFEEKNRRKATVGELIQFLGIIILST